MARAERRPHGHRVQERLKVLWLNRRHGPDDQPLGAVGPREISQPHGITETDDDLPVKVAGKPTMPVGDKLYVRAAADLVDGIVRVPEKVTDTLRCEVK